jgi:hypothetical protein
MAPNFRDITPVKVSELVAVATGGVLDRGAGTRGFSVVRWQDSGSGSLGAGSVIISGADRHLRSCCSLAVAEQHWLAVEALGRNLGDSSIQNDYSFDKHENCDAEVFDSFLRCVPSNLGTRASAVPRFR